MLAVGAEGGGEGDASWEEDAGGIVRLSEIGWVWL